MRVRSSSADSRPATETRSPHKEFTGATPASAKSANVGGRVMYRESDVQRWINDQFAAERRGLPPPEEFANLRPGLPRAPACR